jgi:hypothetical protein
MNTVAFGRRCIPLHLDARNRCGRVPASAAAVWLQRRRSRGGGVARTSATRGQLRKLCTDSGRSGPVGIGPASEPRDQRSLQNALSGPRLAAVLVGQILPYFPSSRLARRAPRRPWRHRIYGRQHEAAALHESPSALMERSSLCRPLFDHPTSVTHNIEGPTTSSADGDSSRRARLHSLSPEWRPPWHARRSPSPASQLRRSSPS